MKGVSVSTTLEELVTTAFTTSKAWQKLWYLECAQLKFVDQTKEQSPAPFAEEGAEAQEGKIESTFTVKEEEDPGFLYPKPKVSCI